MHRWKFSVLAAAAVASAGFYAGDAAALALGRITVQSALGEPLRAEIDLPQITPAEADTLRATTATPEVFRAQGMEFTPTMNNLQIQLQRRADGTAVLRLSSDRPVNEPFLDLVLDANWGTGRIVRSYTMLFDPPALRRAAPAVTASPQISAPAAQAQAPRAASPARSSDAAAAPAAPRPAAAPRAAPADGVTVQAGDTAGRIANAYRPASVSLDQMLVAMMRANPDAFIQGNVNRLKAGAVLQMPDQAAAQATPAPEARQMMSAQARDFNEFRRKLAGAAPSTEVAAAQRSATGTVQTRVEDKKPATTAPDKLTLSKGSVAGQKAAEDQVAKDKQATEAAARMAELSKNITDLNKLGGASAPSGAAAPAAADAASAPAGVAVQTPAVPATPTAPEAPASDTAASAPTDASVPAADAASEPASAPVEAPVVAAPPVPAPAPAPVEEPGFLAGLIDDPVLPLAGGGLLALLLGYGAYRVVQRRKENAGVDSSFLESRIQPDSFFGASGGQRVDTANSEMTTGSSMAYSPSQLDAGGDVDPVAEADVYLAYGRDLQAEEILKEAIRHNPARVSVHVKLGEIYAKRQDRKAFEAVAGDVFKLTQGEGPDWARIAELGRDLEPENRLYQPGGRPGLAEDESPSIPPGGFASTYTGAGAAGAAAASPPDFDLDLDLDLPDDALTEAPPAAAGGFAAAAAAAASTRRAADDADEPQTLRPELDLPDLPQASAPPAWSPQDTAPSPMMAPPPVANLDFPSDELSMAPSGPMPLSGGAPDSGPMEFDLGELSLDLNAPTKPMAAAAAKAPAPAPAQDFADDGSAAAQDDPLATKLALAEEFNAIGDTDGARTLIEEVVAESSGALKTRAQRMLAELG
ncbi:MAG: hypothetical protein KKB95_06195 [Gammaproteobacteria bacterium]|nr:hypothetical protein [Gammaproteobacteria bacterium]MBU2120017.1 hypothetical protein [Gammaproteobacteria bacterium]MBU2170029.1 hypothetical protein [Gammaproteobacteria bacterium]MBU2202589.1 hypothetical protein [Gammaproteobacteria bacterium]MBU2276329.1 hypothetical protein [Gammaproteobacteria bacterium]